MELQLGKILLLLILAVAAYQDIQEMKINICLPIISAGLGIVWRLIIAHGTLYDIFLGSLTGVICLLISRITGDSVGIGDGLMLVVSGIFLGFWMNITILMLAFGVVGLVGLYMLVIKKKGRNYRMPFLPYLLAAYLCVLL